MYSALFKDQGYLVVPQVFPLPMAASLLHDVQGCIASCAADLAVSTAEYLRVVSRWHTPSPVTQVISDETIGIIQSRIEDVLGVPLRVNKWNIITKNRHTSGPVPCHQDLPYSPASPYAFSTWMALNPILSDSGGLKVLPGSHRGPIVPAVDFWSPDFQDTRRASAAWQNDALTFSLNPGDCIVFDSRLWHGSDANLAGEDRYAFVSRWETPDFFVPLIPPRPVSDFGMWTCGAKTEECLRGAMRGLYPEEPALERAGVLYWWIDALAQGEIIIPDVDAYQAVQALKELSILDRAAHRHQGGDAEGRIYQKLYHVLLNPLSQSVPERVW